MLFGKNITESVSKSRIYSDGDVRLIKEDSSCHEAFWNLDTISAAYKAAESYPGKRVAILNFASYKNPGGGFMTGAMAQEEAICHESTLFPVLSSLPSFYEENRKDTNSSMYRDRAIYSPGIVLTRKKPYIAVDVLTCASPNRSASFMLNMQAENRKILFQRSRFIAAIMKEQQVNIPILGAWGCGVFGQDPGEVHEALHTAFQEAGFKEIVYAVPGRDQNAEVFRKKVQ